jgi:hypothetical protein
MMTVEEYLELVKVITLAIRSPEIDMDDMERAADAVEALERDGCTVKISANSGFVEIIPSLELQRAMKGTTH